MITVRIAHAEPGPGRPADTGPRIDPRVPVVARLLGFDVVLADDAGHRALRAWLARDPDGTPLPALLDRPGDDIWTTQGIPEELAVRLMSAAGGSVTGVEIHPDRADIEEVTEQTCTARIELGGPSGTRHVTARLDLGLTRLDGRVPRRVPRSGGYPRPRRAVPPGQRGTFHHRPDDRTVHVRRPRQQHHLDPGRRRLDADEITARVPGDSDAVLLGIFLAAAGQIELRNPELIRRH